MPVRLPAPKAPPYDPRRWQAMPWSERWRLACQAWALDGYGAPRLIHLLYAVKVLLWVAAWAGFCTFNAGGAEAGTFGSWVFHPDAFKKAVLWSMAFEGLGLGCASGPLSGRYIPPVAAFWHFLRPGTIKLPPLRGLPGVGGDRRGWLEVGLYVALLASIGHALVAAEVTPERVLPVVLLVGGLGLTDKTVFLACRAEHYAAMAVCFLFPDDWIAGAAAVQVALWTWAGVAKLNRHFPAVIAVMTSNSPILRWAGLRKAMYRAYPDDLRPSRLAHGVAHAGTAVELLIPALLLLGDGGPVTLAGLGLMVAFHAYITSNFPMAVPLEWNVMMVYGGLFLLGGEGGAPPGGVDAPLLTAFLALALGVVPCVGHLWPSTTSFLMAMRYYAGNWAYSVWLFRGDSADKLDAGLCKVSPRPEAQLARLYDDDVVIGLMSKVPAFRAMHLHGRALQVLLPQAVDDMDAYTYADGEVVAGMALGYNFGDGHLHDHRLLAAIQARCAFEPGELRHVFVESQPLFRPRLRWRIHDAAEGLVSEGRIDIDDLLERQPWPPPVTGS